MKVCIKIPKEDFELLDQVRQIEGVTVREVSEMGAAEYIAIFVPIFIVIAENAPQIISDLCERNDVEVKVAGRTIKDSPKKVVDAICEMPEVYQEIEKLLKKGKIEVSGNAKGITTTYRLLNELKENKKNVH